MLTIVCGEDNVASRNYFLSLLNSYKEKAYKIQNVSVSDLSKIRFSASEQTLFGEEQIFIVENLNKSLSRKKDLSVFKILEDIAKSKQIVLIDWEDEVSQRNLKIGKIGLVKEFKPDKNIFKLLDTCYPQNLQAFHLLLSSITDSQNEMFVFIMLQRHIRNLLLAKMRSPLSQLQAWQKMKLSSQARRWKEENIISFYDRLLKIDISTKTGKNPYTIKTSLEILSCYYL